MQMSGSSSSWLYSGERRAGAALLTVRALGRLRLRYEHLRTGQRTKSPRAEYMEMKTRRLRVAWRQEVDAVGARGAWGGLDSVGEGAEALHQRGVGGTVTDRYIRASQTQTWQVAGETSQYGLGFTDDVGTRVWNEKNGVHQLMKTRRTRLLLPSHLEMQSPCLAIQIAAV